SRSLGRAVALTGLTLECNRADISLQSTGQNSKAVSDILGHLFTHPSPSLSPPGNRTAAQAGHSAVMTCPPRTGATMVTWKISPKIGGPCNLVFRADQNLVNRTNCSDSVKTSGNGNFHQMYQLTVLVPPRLSLYCDNHSIPVCEAAAGRPAAEILWVPENSSTTEIDSHDNGTVTVLSRFTAHSTDRKTVTCKVYHATLNETMSTDCSSCKLSLVLEGLLVLHVMCSHLRLSQAS
uniref:Ig-like domain-containing protein n=1 Tax=Anas platyrhynchos TaxID=8839 RepID=A0A8B9SR26_ANAPL